MTIYLARGERKAPVTDPGYKRGSIITATVHLVHLDGNQRPYFSATGNIATKAERDRGDFQAGGCIHEEILRYFPDLAPVVAVHLADDDGVPMYAVENGAYHLGMTKWTGYNQAHVMSHFRISADEADALHERITDREQLAVAVDEMRPRWAQKAAEALAVINRYAVTA